MTKPALIAVLISTSLIAACGGAPAPDAPIAPTSAPDGATAGKPVAPVAPTSAPDGATAGKPVAPTSAPDGASASAPGASASAPGATADKTAGKPVAPIKVAPAKPAFTRTDIQVGTGREAVKGKNLSVNYTGWLYDPSKSDLKGRMFDTSTDRGPFTFVLGAGQVIPGWDNGFQGMKIGGRRRLIIPSDMAYGVDGAGDGIIPPNATLVFEMELLDVQQ